ncbi:hypothetical protein FCL47_22360 [Desulfopila sp. IMCC35006]|uniref:hypothetical protein n=1 Tax=Desulfopila sp. IMCC35006 TaxID=2569542 RepID=UPI001135750C|nr:hypothetical protein [Desulfopila sp. IMCC35006]TKB23501.1 hypothetical protein FCL47_22360 [Desulfopila sp. IMCC35006]
MVEFLEQGIETQGARKNMEENNNLISKSDLGKGLADAAIQALLESRGLKIEDVKTKTAHHKRISEAIARLEKEKKLEELSVFCSRIKLSFNDENFKKLSELANIESKKYLTHYADSVDFDTCSEEIVYNYFINIQIPENLFGFSKEFFLSCLFTLVVAYITGKNAEKDKEEILKAIKEINKG